ncbi:acetolactate decarboxylase [Alysiella filiformis]|nr:acetolactate decarboxylase [Alysiella filiformis]UBQ56330.1 acetolactate decarboxylase [Alysiella filiformis DSM 16848]
MTVTYPEFTLKNILGSLKIGFRLPEFGFN